MCVEEAERKFPRNFLISLMYDKGWDDVWLGVGEKMMTRLWLRHEMLKGRKKWRHIKIIKSDELENFPSFAIRERRLESKVKEWENFIIRFFLKIFTTSTLIKFVVEFFPFSLSRHRSTKNCFTIVSKQLTVTNFLSSLQLHLTTHFHVPFITRKTSTTTADDDVGWVYTIVCENLLCEKKKIVHYANESRSWAPDKRNNNHFMEQCELNFRGFFGFSIHIDLSHHLNPDDEEERRKKENTQFSMSMMNRWREAFPARKTSSWCRELNVRTTQSRCKWDETVAKTQIFHHKRRIMSWFIIHKQSSNLQINLSCCKSIKEIFLFCENLIKGGFPFTLLARHPLTTAAHIKTFSSLRGDWILFSHLALVEDIKELRQRHK